MTLMQVTKAKQQTTAACSSTRCSEMQRIQSNVSGEASALISKQKFSPSVMKSDNVCWLVTARISSSIEIVPAQVLAIKAGLAIPWNKLRLLRRYDIIMQCSKDNSLIFRCLKSSGIHLAGEISSHIVGDNLKGKGKLPPLHFHSFRLR